MTSTPSLLSRLKSLLTGTSVDANSASPATSPENDAPLASIRDESAPAAALQPGLTLIGHTYEILGRSEDIRTGACACGAADIPFSLVNVYGDYGKQRQDQHRDFPYFHKVGTKANHRANLLFLNADEITPATRVLDAKTFNGPYNIGCFAWELSNFPAPWVYTFDLLHEIWVATRFIQNAIQEKTTLPVLTMPFAIEPGPVTGASRKTFNLPDDKFLFLFFFDFRSYIQRKNPWAIIDAFNKAFPAGSPDPVHLVIKVNGQQDKPDEFARLTHALAALGDRVQLIEQTLDDQGIKALVNLSDCFVSLHRSEGFGRGLAEAMYYGKPVIATAYSGNVDFMQADNACLVDYQLVEVKPDEYPFGEGQVWADADVEQAAAYMRKLVTDEAFARQIGTRAAAFIQEYHSYAAVGAAYRRRLQALELI